MKLLANGCSFTFAGGKNMYNNSTVNEDGSDVFLNYSSQHPENLKRLSIAWPSLLARKLGAESSVNLSQGGNGNSRIVRTTLDYFYDLIERGEDPKEYFVIIQWSEIMRREYFDGEHWCNFNPNFGYFVDYTKTDWLAKGNKTDKEMARLEQAKQSYYKHLHSHRQDLTDFFEHVTALGGFFNQLGVPYLFCSHLEILLWAITLNDEIEETEKFYWLNRIKHLERMYTWFQDEIFESSMAHCNLDPCDPEDSHPSVLGHQQFADILYNWIQQKNLLKDKQ